MPYRTLEDKIDGVVITFTDVTVAKTLEAQLRETQHNMEERAAVQTTELAKAKQMLQIQTDGRKRKPEGTGTIPGPDEAGAAEP
jgi:two-component system, chemotaxis family, CheB/CheR fusion protein